MKQALRLALAALCVTLVSLATATAQDQYTEGPVDRVVLVHILPGHFNAFMDDVKNNIKPIWDAEKKAEVAWPAPPAQGTLFRRRSAAKDHTENDNLVRIKIEAPEPMGS